jgi:ribosomal protein S18 acetylase RimI-like enzyme
MDLVPLVPGTDSFERAVDCYWGIYGRSPHGRPDRATAAEMFARHADYPGYRGVVAVDEGSVAGYAYGYSSLPGQYYHDRLRGALDEESAERWLADCFEFVELGVLPYARRRGVGSRLHDAVFAGVDHATSVLTTGTDNAPARRLYEAKGWEPIREPFDGGDVPLAILGRDL